MAAARGDTRLFFSLGRHALIHPIIVGVRVSARHRYAILATAVGVRGDSAFRQVSFVLVGACIVSRHL